MAKRRLPPRGPDGKFIPKGSSRGSRREAKTSAIPRDSKGRFVSKDKPPRKKTPPRGPSGRFLSQSEQERLRRSEAAKRGWEKRRRREKRSKKPARKADEPKHHTLRGPDGKFVSKRKAAAIAAAQAAQKKRAEQAAKKRARKEAAKKGWETRRAKKRAEKEARRKELARSRGKIAPVADFFETWMRWSYNWWEQFDDGTAEGQGMVATSNDSYEDDFLRVAQKALDVANSVPKRVKVWWAMGVVFSNLDKEGYDKYGGDSTIMTFSRLASAFPLATLAAKQIGKNVMGVGGKVKGILVAAYWGKRSPSE